MATVRTVLGEISPDDLGITLSHEHLLLDTSHLFWNEPSTSDPPEIHTLAAAPVTPENSDDLAARPYVSKDNLRMTERDVAIRELLLYRDAGGKSFIDVSGRIPGWHPDDLVAASEATGVNIVASTGWLSHLPTPRATPRPVWTSWRRCWSNTSRWVSKAPMCAPG